MCVCIPVVSTTAHKVADDMPAGMGAFHGYAHARECQIDYHPRIADVGMGLEDFEGCERLFPRRIDSLGCLGGLNACSLGRD